MGIPIEDDTTLYTFQFVGDYVVSANDKEDSE